MLDRKVETPVVFPLEGWDLSEHCLGEGEKEGGRPVYDLFAVSNHFGSRGYGHYTAYAKGGEWGGGREGGQWYRFDDSSCEPVSKEHVAGATREAYILFYRRREEGGEKEKDGGQEVLRSSL